MDIKLRYQNLHKPKSPEDSLEQIYLRFAISLVPDVYKNYVKVRILTDLIVTEPYNLLGKKQYAIGIFYETEHIRKDFYDRQMVRTVAPKGLSTIDTISADAQTVLDELSDMWSDSQLSENNTLKLTVPSNWPYLNTPIAEELDIKGKLTDIIAPKLSQWILDTTPDTYPNKRANIAFRTIVLNRYETKVEHEVSPDGKVTFIAYHPEFNKMCVSKANSIDKAIDALTDKTVEYIEMLLSDGMPIPLPVSPNTPKEVHIGQETQRLADELEATQAALWGEHNAARQKFEDSDDASEEVRKSNDKEIRKTFLRWHESRYNEPVDCPWDEYHIEEYKFKCADIGKDIENRLEALIEYLQETGRSELAAPFEDVYTRILNLPEAEYSNALRDERREYYKNRAIG